MFTQLRNRIIWMIMLATTSIIIVAFSLIFIGATVGQKSRDERGVMPPAFESGNYEKTFREAIQEERKNISQDLLFTLFLVGAGIELIVLIISYLYAERAIRPVKQAYEQQRDFIANASHELKTPIAAIRANFEALDTTEEPWSSNIDTELTHANQLVLDLLTLARTDDVSVVAKKQKADLAQIIKNKVQIVEPRLGKKKITVELPDKCEVETFAADFEQIVNILLDNAVKYSKSWIKVSLSDSALTIKNDGKTISKEKIARIFDRFYQVDKTANGTGLGLAIAKAVADKHRWRLTAASENREIEFKLKIK